MQVTKARLELAGLAWRTLELRPTPITCGVRRREESTKGRGDLLLQAGKHGASAVVALAVAAGEDGEEVGAELGLVEGGGKDVLSGVVSGGGGGGVG